MKKCTKILKNGLSCSRSVNSSTCWQHGGNLSNIKVIRIDTFKLPKKNCWEIYGSSHCPWTKKALFILKNKMKNIIGNQKVYFYDIDLMWPDLEFHAGISKLISKLRSKINNHKTIPMIFNQKTVFIGGYENLITIK